MSKSMAVSVSDSRSAATYLSAQLSLGRQLTVTEAPFISVLFLLAMPLRMS